VRPPEETVAAFEHHISRVTGIIGWLQPALNDSAGNLIHTYFSGICILSNPKTYEGLKSEIRHGSAGGKGASPSQGKASGLCEALERYSASFHGNEHTITSSYSALGDKAIHPNKCMNYSSLQYQRAAQWNNAPRATRATYVPPPFDESTEIDWTPVWSLTEQTFKYLPTTYCYFGARNSNDSPLYAPSDSNGNAAGNTLEEAILQGFMELVERDSIGIWWYNRLQRPAVDIDSFNNVYIAQLRAFFQSHHRDLWVIDISNDLNVPVFAAISRRNDKEREDIIYGYGAHFDQHIALLRAVTEVCQSFSMFLLAGYGDTLPSYNPQADYWWHTATIANQPHLSPHPDLAPRKFADYPRQWREDLRDDVTACVNLVQNLGMETLALDQTQPDVGLHVVKVFVPGLRHDWRRTGPGRLYDVPVKMGWLDKPLSEEELNPFSIYF
jgi:ribosomal protein S12 methylthiotransferase accessory factor